MRRSWGLGGTLPVGEALWQEGICGHRVYLTSLLQPLTAWVGPLNDNEMAGVCRCQKLGRVGKD